MDTPFVDRNRNVGPRTVKYENKIWTVAEEYIRKLVHVPAYSQNCSTTSMLKTSSKCFITVVLVQ